MASLSKGRGRPSVVVHFCTSNSNKLREVQTLLEGVGVELRPFDADLPELQGESPQSIAREKCRAACKLLRERLQEGGLASEEKEEFVLTEDTALCFEALGGLPGPYIKWFLKSMGQAGLPKLLAAFENKAAYAMTNLCLANSKEELRLFEGRCEGRIVEPRGSQAFGWDCVFEEATSKKTFGEMAPEEKNKISHRARAMEQLRTYLEGLSAVRNQEAPKYCTANDG